MKLKDSVLFKEIHPKLNLHKDLDSMSTGSNIKLFWECPKEHHMWVASVKQRKTTGCPYCSGNRRVVGVNDLWTTHPGLAKQLVNPNLGYDLSESSSKSVDWSCGLGHVWSVSTSNRVKHNTGCPYCANKKVWKGYNDMWSTHPELAIKLLDQNQGHNFTGKSGKKLHWLCPEKHVWSSTPANILAGNRCPYCSKRKSIRGNNDAYTLHPEIIPYVVNPEQLKDVRPKSNLRVECLCPKDGYRWTTMVCSLTDGTRCPVCSNNVVVRGINDLWTTHPKMASQLVDSNVGYRIGRGSNIKQDFICRKGHITSKTPSQRPDDADDCVLCSQHTSKAEKTIAKILLEKGFEVTPQFSRGPLKRVDILLRISDKEIGIEYDGAYFHQFKYEDDVLKTETSLRELDLTVRVREYNKRYPLYKLPSSDRYLEISSKDMSLEDIVDQIISWVTSHDIINKEQD